MVRATVMNVTSEQAGGFLTLPVQSGASTLALSSVSDFSRLGGQLKIEGEILRYVAIDTDLNTVTLDSSTPLLTSYPSTYGLPYVLAIPFLVIKRALVLVEEQQDGEWAEVDHALFDKLPDGVRDPNSRESVELQWDPTRRVWKLTNILFREPSVDGSYIDPESIPSPSGVVTLPTQAPSASPTPRPYQASGSVVVVWQVPTGYRTQVRLFLAPAVENIDGSGMIDAGISPGASNLYSDSLTPEVKLTNLTPGGVALDPKKHYQVSLQAWNEYGAAPPTPWVLCQPAFVSPAVIADTVIADFISGKGIQIAYTPGAQTLQNFDGAALPTGWVETRRARNRPAGQTSVQASVISSGPTGSDGAVLKFDPGNAVGTDIDSISQVTTNINVGDFLIEGRFYATSPLGPDNSSGSYLWIGARADNSTISSWSAWDLQGLALYISQRDGYYNVRTQDGTFLSGTSGFTKRASSSTQFAAPLSGWYKFEFSCVNGIVSAAVWEEAASAERHRAYSQIAYDAGLVYMRMNRFSRYNYNDGNPDWVPTYYIDWIKVTNLVTGFQVLPDGSGDWPGALDPIRYRLTQLEAENDTQDTRLTTVEGYGSQIYNVQQKNIAQDQTLTANGNRLTALEGIRGISMTRTTTFSVPASAWAVLPMTATEWLTDGLYTWSSSGGYAKVLTAGIYEINFMVGWSSSNSGRRLVRLHGLTDAQLADGTYPGTATGILIYAEMQVSAASSPISSGTVQVQLAAGTNILVTAYQSSAAALNAGGQGTRVQIRKLA